MYSKIKMLMIAAAVLLSMPQQNASGLDAQIKDALNEVYHLPCSEVGAVKSCFDHSHLKSIREMARRNCRGLEQEVDSLFDQNAYLIEAEKEGLESFDYIRFANGLVEAKDSIGATPELEKALLFILQATVALSSKYIGS